jgi:hypothetical protein|tara:strand:- start:52 stop:225 length:174 start_codon:yes stop_codon:yes gene_type:complete
MSDGPLLSAFENVPAGVIRQELVTYFMRDEQLIKQKTERTYLKDGDYNDSTVITPLT